MTEPDSAAVGPTRRAILVATDLSPYSVGTMLRTLGVLVAAAAIFSGTAAARDHVVIVGSSTVYPFAVSVAHHFAEATGHPVPAIRSTGTGEGFRLFCAGLGDEHPDVANASRRLTRGEWDQCAENGVTAIVEVKIGYDGIVVANARQAPFVTLSSRQIFLALAKTVPHHGALVPNPYRRWIEISLTLPAYPIRVLGPPSSSGTRDTFVELALRDGCESFALIRDLKETDARRYHEVCATLRDDGPYVDAGENDALIVEQLAADESALGIFGYSFLSRNRDLIKGSPINGEAPTFDTIARGDYPLARPLYFYFKEAHVQTIPGLREYVAEFTDEWSLGPEGYLIDEGLIPLQKQERRSNFQRARELTTVGRDDL